VGLVEKVFWCVPMESPVYAWQVPDFKKLHFGRNFLGQNPSMRYLCRVYVGFTINSLRLFFYYFDMGSDVLVVGR
jgi:hypothetical protein